MKKSKVLLWEKIKANRAQILRLILISIFILHVFLRFYELEERNGFTWDQVDNAWAAKDILIDGKFPLVGMQAKQNSGIFIGPLYYYYILPFYSIFNMDPIASAVAAGVTSIITFFILFFITRRLFSTSFALLVIFLHTMSFYIIEYDRSQWPINFIAPISLVIFYFLYKIITGNPRFILPLAIAVGLSFHLNFTAIFFPLIILGALPFFPRTKEILRYILFAIPIFFLFFVPNIIVEYQSGSTNTKHIASYIDTYSHGFHVRRFLQVASEAFIEFDGVLRYKFSSVLKYIFPVMFCFLYYFQKKSRERLLFCYLVALWFLIPWLVFSLYKGEISNYYFALTRPFVLIIISYILYRLFEVKSVVVKALVVAILIHYSYMNMQLFFTTKYQALWYQRLKTEEAIKKGEKIEFTQGDPKSYIYYIRTRK